MSGSDPIPVVFFILVALLVFTLAIIMLIFSGVVRGHFKDLKAARQKKAGHCWSCGYILAGLDRCPECGKDASSAPSVTRSSSDS